MQLKRWFPVDPRLKEQKDAQNLKKKISTYTHKDYVGNNELNPIAENPHLST